MNIDELFKYSCVISINKNKLDIFYKIFNHYFNKKPLFIQGCTNIKNKGYQNCTKSHCKCIEYAKQNNWPFVVIFEDDAYPSKDAKEKLNKYLIDINENNIDIIRLGFCHIYEKTNLNDFSNNLNKMTKTGYSGSHAELIFNSAYDKYLQHCKKYDFIADHYLDITKNVFFLKENLFIQYCQNKSMNNHIGYIADKDYKKPPARFEDINSILK